MNDLEANRYSHMGKRARSIGCPRTIDDGRLGPASREAWRAGWDWQDDYMRRPQESEEERAERLRAAREGLAEIVRRLNTWASDR